MIRADLERDSLGATPDQERWVHRREGLGEHAVEEFVAVRGVVVKWNQLFYARQCSELQGVCERAVSPTHPAFVFFPGVLGIMDEKVNP